MPQDVQANSVPVSSTSQGMPITVPTIVLGKLFEAKVYAVASPQRGAKRQKDLTDVSWIIQNAPSALQNVQRTLDLPHRMYLLQQLAIIGSPLVQNAQHILGLAPPPDRRPERITTPVSVSGTCNPTYQTCVSIINFSRRSVPGRTTANLTTG